MHDFSIFRALFSDSISPRFTARQIKDAPHAGHDYAVCGCEPSPRWAACDEGEHGLQHIGGTPGAKT